MSATNHTPNLNLSQFIPLDKPAWLGDYNSDMSKIDTAVHKVQTQANSMETAVEQATTAAQAATQAAQAATEAAQDAADKAQDAETTANNIAGSLAGKVNKTGDTMTGPLILPGDPTEDNQATTKAYVDAATKAYADAKLSYHPILKDDTVTGAVVAGYAIQIKNTLMLSVIVWANQAIITTQTLFRATNFSGLTSAAGSVTGVINKSNGSQLTLSLSPNILGNVISFTTPVEIAAGDYVIVNDILEIS